MPQWAEEQRCSELAVPLLEVQLRLWLSHAAAARKPSPRRSAERGA